MNDLQDACGFCGVWTTTHRPADGLSQNGGHDVFGPRIHQFGGCLSKNKLLCISPLSFHKQNPNYSATDAPWSKTSWCRVICCLRKWRYFHLILGTRNCLILIQFFAFFRQNRLVFRLGSYLSQKRLYTTMKWGSRKKDNST